MKSKPRPPPQQQHLSESAPFFDAGTTSRAEPKRKQFRHWASNTVVALNSLNLFIMI